MSIGSWTSEASLNEHEGRDRIRFCFRNSSDQVSDSTLSASEAALVTPDRLSISVANGTRRIVIPANHISEIKFYRRIGEIVIHTDGWAAFESASTPALEDIDSGTPATRVSQPCAAPLWHLSEEDITKGQLARGKVIKIKLEQQRPLTEPKWTRGSLAEHIDVNSRFLKILRIMDAEVQPTLETFLDQWARDDADRSRFYEYELTSDILMQVLTNLMSPNNVLSPSLSCLLEGMLDLFKASDVAEPKLLKVLKQAIFLIPPHMLRMSLDTVYEEHCSKENSGAPHSSQAHLAGGKRQRGESEVPSEQLARTTLDEKRRRLSESEPQPPVYIKEEHGLEASKSLRRLTFRAQCSTPNSRDKKAQPSSDIEPATEELVTTVLSETGNSTSSPEDGARMSREETLRALEDCEDQTASSDTEEQDAPIEAAAVGEESHVLNHEEWPGLGTDTT